MLLNVCGVGKQKIKYKDHSTINFDSLSDYLLLAKKAISKLANSIYVGLAQKMLKDEDAICAVANAIMMADWRWDENYTNTQGTKKNRYSYRNQCALWAIQTYATKNNKRSKYIDKMYSLDYDMLDDQASIHEKIEDHSSVSPEQSLIESEYKQEISNLIKHIFELQCLSDRQKEYIRLYYIEGYTFEKIGKKYHITREAVRQGLNKSINLLKDLIGDNIDVR
jgi:RNA polymerase sigma factor (sigma-70 family)